MNLVTITEDNGHYKVTANTVYIGDIYMEVDGGWVFGPGTRGGFWPARLLREIVAKLDELNHPWPPDEAPTTCTWTRWNGVTAICGCLDAYWHWSAQHNHCPFCGKPIVLVDQARPPRTPVNQPDVARVYSDGLDPIDMSRAFDDYAYAREQLVLWAVSWEFIYDFYAQDVIPGDTPLPAPPAVRELLKALQDGARLACAVTNRDGHRERNVHAANALRTLRKDTL